MNIYLYWTLTIIAVYFQVVALYTQYGVFNMIDTEPDIMWRYATLFGVFIVVAKEFLPITRKTRTKMNVIITIVLLVAYLLRVYFDVMPAFRGK